MLARILPSEGEYCVAYFETRPKPEDPPRHKWFTDIAQAEAYAKKKDEAGVYAVYVAQASYDGERRRRQAHVHRVRSLWLDIDCGPGKPFANQKTAILALKQFCKDTGLPYPTITSSGWGIYAHWALSSDILPVQWKATAELLKAATKYYKFDVDQSRTADIASVLRPLGVTNRKVDDDHKVTSCLWPSEVYDYATIHATLAGLPSANLAPAPKVANSNLAGIDWGTHTQIPSHAAKIAEKCQQVKVFADAKGDVSEPFWYHAICLLRHTEEAPDIIFRWSSGHPQYSVEATQAKIDQANKVSTGPTLCNTFENVNPGGCVGCPHSGKLSSPLLLGRHSPDVAAVENEEGEAEEVQPEHLPPRPFRRTQNGLVGLREEVETVFYGYDLYLSAIGFDESLGYEVMTIRHHLPLEGWMEFTIRSSLVTDPSELMKVLWDNHVKVVGQWERRVMVSYMESFAEQLQRNRRITQLMCQMGWRDTRDGLNFVLGRMIYGSDGSVEDASLAKNIPSAAQAFHAKGEAAPWIEATKIFNQPGMEPFAFAFCAAAFGAPLMRFTGYPGAIVSMVGPSGAGKTLMGMWGLSAYGDPTKLLMLKDDTQNALIGRLGVYGNLPLYVDEVTNMRGDELSTFVYRITQGRDKARQTKEGVEKRFLNHWNTLAVVSSNSSLTDRLCEFKGDVSAELNRIFQFDIRQVKALDRHTATGIYRMFTSNYGVIGQTYVADLVRNWASHREMIDHITAKIDARTGASGEERFWSAVAGATLYGAAVAHRLGLIKFDMKMLFNWCIEAIEAMRGSKKELVVDGVSALAQFLDENIGQRLVMKESSTKKGELVPVEPIPRGELSHRYEEPRNRVYVSRNAFKTWCSKRHFLYNVFREELLGKGILVNPERRKVLGANTNLAGAQLPCWEIDTSHPELGQVKAKLVEVPKTVDQSAAS